MCYESLRQLKRNKVIVIIAIASMVSTVSNSQTNNHRYTLQLENPSIARPYKLSAPTEQQVVATFAKQSLPKCHPDVIDGEVAMFHSWKKFFKVKVNDMDLEADQEINYLNRYMKSSPKLLVDN